MAEPVKPGSVGHFEYKGDKAVFVVDDDANAEEVASEAEQEGE